MTSELLELAQDAIEKLGVTVSDAFTTRTTFMCEPPIPCVEFTFRVLETDLTAWNTRHDARGGLASPRGEAVDSPAVQLSEMLRGLEIGPDAATWPAAILFSLCQKIAAQAKHASPPSAGVVVSDTVVMAACIAAYSACDMGPFPSMAVDPASDMRFVRAALEAALAAAPRGEGKG